MGGITKVYFYEDFYSVIKGKKYDFISIDGPWGSDYFSRIDIIDYIPNILKENFVILVDDYERRGEKNMVKLLRKKLDENGILYALGEYASMKDVCVIASKNCEFFTTM